MVNLDRYSYYLDVGLSYSILEVAIFEDSFKQVSFSNGSDAISYSDSHWITVL